MYARFLTHRLTSTSSSILLLGPRQVGKSTLIRSLEPAFTVDLADESLFLQLSKDIGLFKRTLAAAGLENGHSTVFVDEVQRLPGILNTVQHLIDTRGIRFLLTGSSARKLRRDGVNLLPGRLILENLTPLMQAELGDDFDLERALQLGMLPGIWADRGEAVDRLGTYAEVYLREEIRVESLARNIGDFARFLDIAALSSGAWLNYSKLASDTEVPKETIRRFFALLVDTLVVYRLENFRPKIKLSRRVPQRTRFFFFDIGVRNAILKTHRHPVVPELRGSIFEQWLILQILYLRAINRDIIEVSAFIDEVKKRPAPAPDGLPRIFLWGNEIDDTAFVSLVEECGALWAIEIKSGSKVDPRGAKGLAVFKDIYGKYKPARLIIAYAGESRQCLENGVEVLPYRELLGELLSAPINAGPARL